MNFIIILETILIISIYILFTINNNLCIKGGKFELVTKENWNNLINKNIVKIINHYNKNMLKEAPMIVDDIQHEMEYKPHSGFIRNYCHKGQRKLFLSELQALTLYPNIEYVIYVGSAPSRKSYIYYHLFPNTKFIFIDPAEFNIEIGEMNDFINKKYRPMTDASTMYDRKDTNILWLYDNYALEGDREVYDIVSVEAIKLNRGNNMYEIYNINKKDVEYVNRLDKDMKKWKRTIYDINDCPDIIKEYTKIITDSSYRIFLIQGFMTKTLCCVLRKILKGKKIAFWSDIRTSIDNLDSPGDVDIIWNTSQCYNWINILEPYYYMLKFRIPFYNLDNVKETFKKHSNIIDDDLRYSKEKYGIDFYKNYIQKKFIWLPGKLYLQCYAPLTSTECRLIGEYNKNKIKKEYNISYHESKMFFFNNIQREFAFYDNPYARKELKMNNDTDAMKEVQIWKEYVKYNKEFNIETGIIILNNVAGTCNIREKINWKKYRNIMIKKYPWTKSDLEKYN